MIIDEDSTRHHPELLQNNCARPKVAVEARYVVLLACGIVVGDKDGNRSLHLALCLSAVRTTGTDAETPVCGERYGSYVGEIGPAPENLIKRDFRATGPNEKWLTDITEFQISAGKAYLSPVIDCFDGLVVSWSIGTKFGAKVANMMLDVAIGSMNDWQC